MNAVILAAAKERGIVLGGSVGEIPEIWEFARPYWEAFEMLSPRRPRYVGLSVVPGGLEISQIRAVAPLFGFSEDDKEFVQIIVSLDNEWLTIQNENAKNKPKPSR